MTSPLTRETVAGSAALAGHPVSPEDADRIAAAIGPALLAFSVVEATLPFEAEPARFMAVQMQGGQDT